MRALPRWTLATWVTLARAPAWAPAPRVNLVDVVLWLAGAAAGSATLLQRRDEKCELIVAGLVLMLKKHRRVKDTHLTLLARLTILSSPTTDRLLVETMEKLFEET